MPDSTETTETNDATEGVAPTTEASVDNGAGESGTESKVFDEEYVRKLRDEAASYRTKLRETEAKFEGAKTPDEVEAITKELRATIAAHEAEKARNEAAEEAGLPASFASRLRGETPEELIADAKAFAEALPKPVPAKHAGPVAGGLDPTDRPNDGTPKDATESREKYGPRAGRLI